jgi:hypothetical protein
LELTTTKEINATNSTTEFSTQMNEFLGSARVENTDDIGNKCGTIIVRPAKST